MEGSITIAAPITIKGKPCYMGVVVRRNPSNNYQAFYIHDVVVIEKSKSALSGAANPTGPVAHSDHASTVMILKQIANVNALVDSDITSDEGKFC